MTKNKKEEVYKLSRSAFNEAFPRAIAEFFKLHPKLEKWPTDPSVYDFFSYMNKDGVTIKLICNDSGYNSISDLIDGTYNKKRTLKAWIQGKGKTNKTRNIKKVKRSNSWSGFWRGDSSSK